MILDPDDTTIPPPSDDEIDEANEFLRLLKTRLERDLMGEEDAR